MNIMPKPNMTKTKLLSTSSIITAAIILTPMATNIARADMVGPSVGYELSENEEFVNTISDNCGEACPEILIQASEGVVAKSITNSGEIIGGNFMSIAVIDEGTDISGGIINEVGAKIEVREANESGAIAIAIAGGADVSGGVVNKGTIQGGLLDGGKAFYLSEGAHISGDIDNSGVISADDAFHLVDGSVISGDIINSGFIEGRTLGMINQCEAFDLSGIDTDISGTIINKEGGIIDASKAAFLVQNGADISGGIVNESGALITNNDDNWTNGTIEVNNASISGGITNSGIIEANSNDYAIYFNNLTAVTTLNLEDGGRIIGGVYDETIGNNYSKVSVNGDFSAEGNFRVSSFDVAEGGDFSISEGRGISIISNGLSNNGEITIEAGSYLYSQSPVTGSGKFNIGVKAADGRMKIARDVAPSDVTSGQLYFELGGAEEEKEEVDWEEGEEELAPVAKAIDFSDDTFHFMVDNGSPLTIGAEFVVADDDWAEEMEGIPNITDDSRHYKFTLSYNHMGQLVATVEESRGIEVAIKNKKRQEAINVLQEIIDSGIPTDASLDAIINKALDAADSDALERVVKSMERPVDGSTTKGSLAVANKSASMAMSRLAAVRSGDTNVASADSFSLDNGESGMAAGNPYFFTENSRSKHVWMQAFGQYAEQSERQGFEGYDSHTYGMMFGVDSQEIVEDATIGVAFSYGNTDVDSDSSNNTQINSDTYQISLYGEKALKDDFRVDAIIGYAFSNSDMDIYNIGGVPGNDASANFDGQQVSAQATLSKDISTEHGFKLTPSISANYIYSDTDQYTDTGAGGASATVDNEAMEVFEIGLGVEASAVYQISPCDCGTDWLKPVLRAGVRHDFIGDAMESTTQFVGGGSSFKTYGFTPEKTTYNLGFGFKRYSLADWEATAMYDLEFKKDYYSHNASARIGKRF